MMDKTAPMKKEAIVSLIGAEPKTTFAVCSELIGQAAANWDDWEKFMALNETYVYLQALIRDGSINETLLDDILYYFL